MKKLKFNPKRLVTNICVVVAFISFLFVLGSAGACDRNEITLIQATIQAAFGLFTMYASITAIEYID